MASAKANHGLLPEQAEEVVSAEIVNTAYDRMAVRLQSVVDVTPCVLMVVMVGGMLPGAQLAQRLRGSLRMDYCHLTRYRGAQTGGKPHWVQRPLTPLNKQTVIVVDDIYDEGITMNHVVDECRRAGAKEVISVALVLKRHAQARGRPDLFGLEVPDRYVFGAGMDLNHEWRHLPGIYALTEDA